MQVVRPAINRVMLTHRSILNQLQDMLMHQDASLEQDHQGGAEMVVCRVLLEEHQEADPLHQVQDRYLQQQW